MSAPAAATTIQPHAETLENGDRLGAEEFLRRFEAHPELKKAELINGTVIMPSPVRIAQHGRPDNLIQTWLGTYAAHTPGVEAATNTTVIFDRDNVPQPDALLRLLPERKGRTSINAKGYLTGPPELIVEISTSSVSVDRHDKLRAYRRNGVLEYVIWRTGDAAVDWFTLEGDDFVPLSVDPQGVLRSRCYPGLWLAQAALLGADAKAVLDTLRIGVESEEHRRFLEAFE